MRHIGLVGRRRTGKDTAAEHLVNAHGYARVAFADPLKRAALALDPIIDDWREYPDDPPRWARLSDIVGQSGWERAKDEYPEVRRLLQNLGAGIREAVGDHVWRNRALEQIDHNIRRSTPVVVTDVRYPDEARMLRARGFLLVRLTRPQDVSTAEDAHESETLTDTIPVDLEIVNAGAVSVLLRNVTKAARTPR